MATIRWCPIYPKWDIYQSLWLLGDYIVTIIIWGPVYHHLAFLTGIVELNWLLGLRFQLVLPKNRHCLAHVFLALWLGWKSHEWFPGTINFTNLLFFLDTLTNQAVCTFVKPIWTCRLSGLATNMHNLYRGRSKNKPHLWVRKNTQQNWVGMYNSIIYIYIYIHIFLYMVYLWVFFRIKMTMPMTLPARNLSQGLAWQGARGQGEFTSRILVLMKIWNQPKESDSYIS